MMAPIPSAMSAAAFRVRFSRPLARGRALGEQTID